MRFVGIGCDLVEVARIAGVLRRKRGFLSAHFSEVERLYFDRYREPVKHIAGHFAAKEAIAKSLGVGMRTPLSFDAISIRHDELGKPSAELIGEAKKRWRDTTFEISISHTDDWAIAVALAARAV